VIDDHLMPSGEPVAAPSRHDRNLEALGGSSRLELGLGGVTRVMRRRGLLLILIAIVTFVAIYGASSFLPKRYSSLAWIKITDQTQNLFDKTGSSVDLTKEQRAVVLTLESPRPTAAQKKALGPNQFADVTSVLATGLEASPLIRVDTSASTPEVAEKAANAASAFAVKDRQDKVRTSLDQKAKTLDQAAAGLQQRLSDLSAAVAAKTNPNDPQLPALDAQKQAALNEYQQTSTTATETHTDAATNDGGLEVYEEAIRPADPDFPKPTSWAILGSLAVLLIAAAVIYGREELVGRFHTGDASESRRAGARVLGVLPRPNGVLPRGVVTGAGTTVDEVGLQLVHLLGASRTWSCCAVSTVPRPRSRPGASPSRSRSPAHASSSPAAAVSPTPRTTRSSRPRCRGRGCRSCTSNRPVAVSACSTTASRCRSSPWRGPGRCCAASPSSASTS